MSESSFDFNAFIKESKDVLVTPKSYFSTMKTTGGLGEPVIKALIYGAVAGIISFLWSLLHLGGGMFGGGVGIMIFVWTVIGAVIGLFIGAVLTLIVSAICKGSTDFEANARVTAAVMVIMPISALLGFISGFNPVAGAIVSLVVNIFALYLLYYGLTEALKANPATTKIVMYVLIALLVIFMLVGMGARKRVSKMNTDLKELMQDVQKK
ncbi:MAG: YIP1 family protein [Bacteroidales bacterium]